MTHICNRATEACRTDNCSCPHAVPHEPFIEPGNPKPPICTQWDDCFWVSDDGVRVRCTKITEEASDE